MILIKQLLSLLGVLFATIGTVTCVASEQYSTGKSVSDKELQLRSFLQKYTINGISWNMPALCQLHYDIKTGLKGQVEYSNTMNVIRGPISVNQVVATIANSTYAPGFDGYLFKGFVFHDEADYQLYISQPNSNILNYNGHLDRPSFTNVKFEVGKLLLPSVLPYFDTKAVTCDYTLYNRRQYRLIYGL